MYEEKNIETVSFACTTCGADLKYKPGTIHLSCEYCGAENEIEQLNGEIKELDFEAYLNDLSNKEDKFTENFVKCDSCGASSSLDPNITSACCPYCSTPLIVTNAHSESIIQPKSLLPFQLTSREAKGQFKKWIDKLWFAPNDLKKAVLNFKHFKGVYIPYWTYDTATTTQYIGQKGMHYYTTESYTTRENGKMVTRTRQVQHTRWYPAAGHVHKFFDDILVVASQSLPQKYIYKLEPWDLENLVPFDKSFLSGFVTEKYQIELAPGFEIAKGIANNEIVQLVHRDIGGDVQRILSMHSNYNDITFKHLLLPVFISAFRYKNKVFQFLVNGRTGEVQGERPYSWGKIVLAVIAGLILLAFIILFIQQG